MACTNSNTFIALFFDSHFLLLFFYFQQGHTKLPDYVPVGQFQKAPLRDLFTAASADCLNLLGKCLLYEPRRRMSAKEVSPDHPEREIWLISVPRL